MSAQLFGAFRQLVSTIGNALSSRAHLANAAQVWNTKLHVWLSSWALGNAGSIRSDFLRGARCSSWMEPLARSAVRVRSLGSGLEALVGGGVALAA